MYTKNTKRIEPKAEKPSDCELMPLILLTCDAVQLGQAVVFDPAVRHSSLFASQRPSNSCYIYYREYSYI